MVVGWFSRRGLLRPPDQTLDRRQLQVGLWERGSGQLSGGGLGTEGARRAAPSIAGASVFRLAPWFCHRALERLFVRQKAHQCIPSKEWVCSRPAVAPAGPEPAHHLQGFVWYPTRTRLHRGVAETLRFTGNATFPGLTPKEEHARFCPDTRGRVESVRNSVTCVT